MSVPDTRYQNSFFSAQLIENLVDLGVEHFVICPGSRSTPLTAAAVRNKNTKTHVFHDERSAAFFALGIGKTGRLAAMITTSGTAVANAFPAIMEASNSFVPMLLISADRPPELRNSGANQTMDQQKIFGSNVRFFYDFPVPTAGLTSSQIASTLSFAVSRCFGTNAGPVHLNCMFREPLEPIEIDRSKIEAPPPYSHPKQYISDGEKHELEKIISQAKRPLLVIGEIESLSEKYKAYFLTTKLDWPVIVDVSSGVSLLEYKHKLPFSEIIVSEPRIIPEPDLIIQLGRGLTTKQYERWVSHIDTTHIVVDYRSAHYDPGHSCAWRIQTSFESLDFLCALPSPDLSWIQPLQNILQNIPIDTNVISEISIAREITSLIPNQSQLFIGNSMPIRDINNFAKSGQGIISASNRGVSGIDGLISTAAGWAIGNNKHTVLLIGDVSFMHDIGVLFSLSALPISVTIVLINNSGGGIFSFLPIAKQKDLFEKYFATAHHTQFRSIVQAMNIPCTTIRSISQLKTALQDPSEGISVLEIHTCRETNREQHQHIKELIHNAVQLLENP